MVLELEEQKAGSVTVVLLTGRVDGVTASSLEERVNTIVSRGERNVLLDCAGMEYISSAGLRALLLCARKCQGAGGKLAICTLQNNCEAVMKESGFISIIDCYDSRNAATAVAF